MQIIEDLIDRTEWIAALIAVPSVSAETLPAVLGQIAQLQQRITERGKTPFQQLAERFELSETEQQIVMLLVAMRIHGDVRSQIQQAAAAGELGLDAIRKLIYGTLPSLQALQELSPSGALRRFAIIERNDEHGAHVHESKHTWSIAPRVLAFLHGDASIDPALDRVCRIAEDADVPSAVFASDEHIALGRTAMSTKSVVLVAGMPGLGRRTFLRAAARDAQLRVIEIEARRLASDATAFRGEARAIARECRLLAAVPLIVNGDALSEQNLDVIGSELEGLVLVTTGVQRPRLDWERPVIAIEMGQPSSQQRASLWRSALDGIGEQDVQHLVTTYPLAPALIVRAAAAAKARNGGALSADDIVAGIRAVLDDKLGQFARRVTVTQSWDDLVLPQEQVDAIVELVARIRERRRVYEEWGFAAKVGKGLGTAALFSGPPGTGKTMVAALIAKDLGLELYQVDLGKVVSKYIGETEKNLAKLFDAAEASHAIVLFDEADALFGKRTDVKSSNDRYANLETNYLLQRLETFTGTCLLTSNHEKSIDPAFLRRLSLHLRFDVPDLAERALLWRAMLPARAPVGPGIDFGHLARRFAMSGGYIRNAALRAAFLAAHDDSPITAEHLERAARREYEALGKIASP